MCTVLILACTAALGCQPPVSIGDEFVRHVRERELVLRQSHLTIQASSTNGSRLLIREIVEATFSGEKEKWVTRLQRDTAAPEGNGPVWDSLEARLPTIVLCAGGRSLKFTPHDHVQKAWLGTRFIDARNDHRRGPVLAGLMFAGRWLSECLAVWPFETVPSDGDGANAAPVLRLVFDHDAIKSTHREFDIEVDPERGYYPVRTRLTLVTLGKEASATKRELRMATCADELVLWRNVWLPSKVEVTTYYGQEARTAGTLSYASISPSDADKWLLDDLPKEVADVDGAVQMWDELTRAMSFLGNEAIIADLRASLQAAQKRSQGRKRGPLWWWIACATGTLVLGGVASLVIARRMRTVAAVVCALIASSLTMGCADPECTAIRVSPGHHVAIGDMRPGEVRDFSYDLTNCSSRPVVVRLVAKSCECVGVRIPDGPIEPTRSIRIVAEAGLARGASTLTAAILLKAEHAAGGALGMLRLTLSGSGGLTRGIQIAPRTLTVTRHDASTGFERSLDLLVVSADGQHAVSTAVAEVKTPAPYRASVGDLTQLDARRWSARLFLVRSPEPVSESHHSERIVVALRVGAETATESIDVRILE